MTLPLHSRSDSIEWAQELRLFIEETVISILAISIQFRLRQPVHSRSDRSLRYYPILIAKFLSFLSTGNKGSPD